jgi:hypothetical protein
MAAPKYNLYALGNSGGRPPHYKTPEELHQKIVEYFDFCVSNKENITITGLALFLGFSSRTSFTDYLNRSEEFSNIIKRARMSVEKAYENNLHGFAWAGAAFALRNINGQDWKEETTQTQVITDVKANFNNSVQPTQETSGDTPTD